MNTLFNKITNKISNIFSIQKHQTVFNGECKIKYLFFSQPNSNKLLVVFSAFPDINQSARYHYVKSFEDINCNKLYILDNYGPNKRGGSYYLAQNRDFKIERSVHKLISSVGKQHNIPNNNIITCGTSKGGFAALYYALKYQYQAAVVGAPQTLLGNYLYEGDNKIFLEYISGGISEGDKKFLNELLFDVTIQGKEKPKLFLHVGTGEHHYPEHIIPFKNLLDRENIPYELNLEDYDNHSQVGVYFPPYARMCFEVLLNS